MTVPCAAALAGVGNACGCTMTAMNAGQPARKLATLLAVIAVLALPGTDGSHTSYVRAERSIARGRLLASSGCVVHRCDDVSPHRRYGSAKRQPLTHSSGSKPARIALAGARRRRTSPPWCNRRRQPQRRGVKRQWQRRRHKLPSSWRPLKSRSDTAELRNELVILWFSGEALLSPRNFGLCRVTMSQ